MKSKRGQATVMVLVGIILAGIIILGLFYGSEFLQLFTEQEVYEGQNPEVNEIDEYVALCISDLGEEALDMLGMRGGYIDIPDDEIVVNLANPLPNRLVILPGLETAYWFFDEGNGVQRVRVPEISDMEVEVAGYIDSNIERCTIDFDLFESAVGYRRSRTSVQIMEEDVLIETNFPLNIVRDGDSVKIEDFEVNLEKPVGELYGNAVSIMEAEMENNFLEEKTLDMFIVYDEIPYSGVDFECTPRVWNKVGAFRNIKSIVSNNIQYLKIKGTNYDLINKDHQYFEVDALKNKDSDLNVNFMFSDNWPMLIDVAPDDNLMTGESFADSEAGRFLNQFFCLNYYNFVYDLRYPVLVSLSKDDYTFQFGTQVIIDNNQPKENLVDLDYLTGEKARVCEHLVTPINVDVLGGVAGGSFKELSDAKVSFKCLGVTCDIGSSDQLLKFPACLNGLIIAEKSGYHRGEELISTNVQQSISMMLDPIYEKDLQIVVVDEGGGERSITNNEFVLVNFRDEDKDYTANLFYPEQNKISLIEGNYDVKINLVSDLNPPLTIEAETMEHCVKMPKEGILGFLGSTEKKCYDTELPAVKLNQVISGGVEFEYTVTKEQLASNDKLVVYVIRNKLPSSLEEVGDINEKIVSNRENGYFKLPRLV